MIQVDIGIRDEMVVGVAVVEEEGEGAVVVVDTDIAEEEEGEGVVVVVDTDIVEGEAGEEVAVVVDTDIEDKKEVVVAEGVDHIDTVVHHNHHSRRHNQDVQDTRHNCYSLAGVGV